MATVGRLHVAGMGLSVLLLVKDATGSLTFAGTAAGALSLGVGATRPVQGRLLDRSGRMVVLSVATTHAALAAALISLGASDGLALTALAFALGFTCPALSVVTRSAIASRVPTRRQPAVLGVDSALQNAAFAAGPLIAGAVAAAAAPAWAVVVLVATGLAAAAAVSALAPLERPATRRSIVAGPVLRPFARPLALTVGHGIVYGSLGVAGVALVLERAGEHLVGPVVAAVFVGGLAGDLLIAPRGAQRPLEMRLRARTLGLLVAVCLAVLAPGVMLFLIAVVVCGAALGVVGVTVLLDVSARSRPADRAEAFGWAGATLRLGDAVGAATAGLIAGAFGPRPALLVAIAGALAAVAAARVRRSRKR